MGLVLIGVGFPFFVLGIAGYAQYSGIAAYYDMYVETYGRPPVQDCIPDAGAYIPCPMVRPSPLLSLEELIPSSFVIAIGGVISIVEYSRYVPQPSAAVSESTPATTTTDGAPFK